MKYLFFGLCALFLSAAFCSATTVYGYTGQDTTGTCTATSTTCEDTQFLITQTNVCNSDTSGGTCSPKEDTLTLPSNSFVLTTASVTADGYATLAVPDPPAGAGIDAKWIGPQANQDAGTTGGPINSGACCDGTTTFTVTFTLSFNASDPITLKLILAADDEVSDTTGVTLNGHAVTLASSPAYSTAVTLNPTTPDGDYVQGTNTLSIVADNSGGGATGLDAFFEVTDTQASTPEPVTLALTGLGLAGLGALRLRHRS
jgi:hypothetical protein